MVFADSHCHLVRNGTQPEHLASTLEQAKAKGVEIIVSMAMTLESSATNVRLAPSYPIVQAAVGIHPWNAVPLTDELRRDLGQLAGRKGVTAIGEIGLDYARNPETKEAQKELLRYELSLARERGLPVSIHCRDAHQDMMDILRQERSPDLRGSVHGFSGDRAALKDWLNTGFCISIGGRGVVTNEIPDLLEVISEIPLDRLLTESEGAGDPSGVVSVAEKLASLRRTTLEEIANATTVNLRRLLKL